MISNTKGLHFLQSQSIYYCDFAKVFTQFAQNFQRFCSDFKWFCPDFHQIKSFWGALSPPDPPASYTSEYKCERFFETYVVIFTYIFRCSGSSYCFDVAA